MRCGPISGIRNCTTLFSDDALKRIAAWAQSIPRRINQICTAALVAGAVAKAKVVDDTAVASRFITWNDISRETIAHSKRAQPDQGVRVCVMDLKQRNLSRPDAFDYVGC